MGKSKGTINRIEMDEKPINQSNAPFYIGWQENMAAESRRFLKRRLVILFILVPILLFSLAAFLRPFNSYQFEFGQVKEYTGVYYASPQPMLHIESTDWPDGISKSCLLVGYGKFGAAGIMNKIQKSAGEINGRNITLKGSLIYGDGKSILELTDEVESFVKINNNNATGKTPLKQLDPISLSGEIIDPKCYFGVMKPAIGKIHKSCAIRCISGGIPPIFRTNEGLYYIILNKNGGRMNNAVLPFVAEQVNITGIPGQFLDWNIIYLDIEDIVLK